MWIFDVPDGEADAFIKWERAPDHYQIPQTGSNSHSWYNFESLQVFYQYETYFLALSHGDQKPQLPKDGVQRKAVFKKMKN